MHILRRTLKLLLPTLLASSAFAAPPRSLRPISVVFLSDIHFNPFNDPGTVARLVAAPISRWNTLLAAQPQSPTLTSAQQGCAAQPDTQYALLQSALTPMRTQAASARFVTISGDLLGHNFLGCFEAFVLAQDHPEDFSFAKPTPLSEAQQRQYSAFVDKTLRYLTTQLALSFPGRPIYIALGNNDTDCDDYRLTPGSDFLRRTGALIALRLPLSQRAAIRRSFTQGGNYRLPIAALPNTTLIVLDDLFLAEGYTSCSTADHPGESASAQSPDPAAAQIAWLKSQLDAAAAAHRKVWVMAHIPPGLDLYRTLKAGHPVTFLKSDYNLTPILTAHPETVRLAIFAHTHFDGMSQLAASDASRSIPLKSVQSLSPGHGNPPSFTVAKIDPRTSDMLEYTIVAAVNAPTKTSPITYTWPAPPPPGTPPTWTASPAAPQ